jgi:rRNA maturation RNase YbeY
MYATHILRPRRQVKPPRLSTHCTVEVSDPGWRVDISAFTTIAGQAVGELEGNLRHYSALRNAVAINCYFVTPLAMRKLNATSRGQDRETDMLSFPLLYSAPGRGFVLGDIVICLDQVELKAVRGGNSFQDQLVFSLVHCLLHLAGHDHGKPEERAVMEQTEESVFAAIALGGCPDVARRVA